MEHPCDQEFVMDVVFPAEWEEHEQTFIIFPSRRSTWRAHAAPARERFMTVATAIAQHEPVTVLVNNSDWNDALARWNDEGSSSNIRLVEMSSDDSWVRDTGAVFVKSRQTGQVCAVSFGFNAYGGEQYGCYWPCVNDILISSKMAQLERKIVHESAMILEGGSIHTDGEGTLITTEECLLHPGRNPSMGKREMEGVFKAFLGIQKVIWLERGLYGDIDTDGHCDNICAFIRPQELVLAWSDDCDDPQYSISAAAEEMLLQSTDAKGRKLLVHRIHIPSPLYRTPEESIGLEDEKECGSNLKRGSHKHAQRLAASYVNFYFCNGGVIIPSFDDEVYDRRALDAFTRLCPDRRITMLSSKEILLGGGNIHCITCQQPASTQRTQLPAKSGRGVTD